LQTKNEETLINLIKAFNKLIKEYEEKHMKVDYGINISTTQCQNSRIDYAGWIAQRDLYQRMLNNF